MRALLALAVLALVASPASAGSPDAPEVSDPAGDAGPQGLALPATHEDVDIVAAWFEEETADTIDLVIKMAGPTKRRVNSGWEQLFDVKGVSYVAGFVDFTPGFAGSFVCEAASVPDSCITTEGGFEGDLVRSRLPKVNISSPSQGDLLVITGGSTWSGVGVGAVGFGTAYDVTEAGLPYVFAKGPKLVENATGSIDAPTVTAPGASPANASVEPAAKDPAAEVPGFAPLLVLAAASLVAALRRR